jgi:hypothetical protein
MSDRDRVEECPALVRLLMWLDDRTRRGCSHCVDIGGFARDEGEALDEEDVLFPAFELERRGLIVVARSLGGASYAHLSGAGEAAVHRMKALREDRTARLIHTLNAFLHWLLDTAGAQAPTGPDRFLAAPASCFAGGRVTASDLDTALTHLTRHHLVDRADTVPATVALTPRGTRCALSGRTVQDCIGLPDTAPVHNTFLPDARGVVIGEQGRVTGSGAPDTGTAPAFAPAATPAAPGTGPGSGTAPDVTLFGRLAGYVGQVSGTLGLPGPDSAHLREAAGRLQAEAASAHPEPRRLRRYTSEVEEKLRRADATVAAAAGVDMAEHALSTLA